MSADDLFSLFAVAAGFVTVVFVGTGLFIAWFVSRARDTEIARISVSDATIRTLEHKIKDLEREVSLSKAMTQVLVQMLGATDVSSMGHIDANSAAKLHGALVQYFNREELEVLAGQIGIPVDSVGGESYSVVAWRIVQSALRQNKVNVLIAAAQTCRPNIIMP